MICIKVDIPKELNEFVEKTKGISKAKRETIYQEYKY